MRHLNLHKLLPQIPAPNARRPAAMSVRDSNLRPLSCEADALTIRSPQLYIFQVNVWSLSRCQGVVSYGAAPSQWDKLPIYIVFFLFFFSFKFFFYKRCHLSVGYFGAWRFQWSHLRIHTSSWKWHMHFTPPPLVTLLTTEQEFKNLQSASSLHLLAID